MKSILISLCIGAFGASALQSAEWPEATLSNGVLQTELYLPDQQKGYYQGTRFDWAGAFKNLTYKGHRYVEQWFPQYDPKLHDAINGPAEEFTPLNYTEAKAGDTFVKIGVGVLRKPDDKPYAFSRYYDVVDYGKRSVRQFKDRIEFTHELSDPAGYGYVYRKTVKLTKGKPELVLEHRLTNTGKLPFETSTYNHNFFIIDSQPTGPTVNVQFPFDVKAEGKGFGSAILTQGNQLVYTRNLEAKEQVYSAGLQGFSATAADYNIRIENMKTGAGVHITCDQPMEKLVYWACSTTSCPEPYVHLKAAPGQEVSWKIAYEFYEKTK